jgi:hypothetical protein
VDAEPSPTELGQLRTGIDLPDGRTTPAEVQVVQKLPAELLLSKGPTDGVWLRMVLKEGKKRQIRQMTAAVGHPTLRLVRWMIGPLTMAGVELGKCEPLTPGEVNRLRHAAGLEELAPPKPARAPRSGSARPRRAGSLTERMPASRPRKPQGSRRPAPADTSPPPRRRPASAGKTTAPRRRPAR